MVDSFLDSFALVRAGLILLPLPSQLWSQVDRSLLMDGQSVRSLGECLKSLQKEDPRDVPGNPCLPSPSESTFSGLLIDVGSIKKKRFIFLLCVYEHFAFMDVCEPRIQFPQRPREGSRSPETGVTDGSESPRGTRNPSASSGRADSQCSSPLPSHRFEPVHTNTSTSP